MAQAFIRIRKVCVAALLTVTLATGGQAEELAVVGTGDGIEMLQALATAYNAEPGETRIAVPPSIGSGGAVAAVGGERQKLGRVARPLTEAEKAQGLVEVPLVRIPSAIFVHRDAGVTGLTSDQVAGIFSGRIENWNAVGGPDLRIRVVRREETDSTLAVLRASMPGWRDLVLTTRSKTATTTQDAVETVRQTPGAIGFGPFSPALAGTMTVLAIDGHAPRDPGYPSAVTLALIYKAATRDAASAAFLAFATSERAGRLLAERGGAPLKP
ncbi:PstS family phosphate ABC transporter substrate-binding protein [Methylobacterium nonmethylotrophicum]|uniref:Phosphate ABC transporter substrate-binding protein n=1 Tax=Methylobacterium nonmethylotrophicum TaxID=1141884 RepID=A0A4Z0NUT1_9HYPH|nr:substrate-binding domain-containing protein [Methylobacterium nonmethylotrophicum]TGE01294.1 phosphate ABC transporter substrate-binding protein [Methylobacterium nonmethylotrophicum]